jgi:hypothetical protein
MRHESLIDKALEPLQDLLRRRIETLKGLEGKGPKTNTGRLPEQDLPIGEVSSDQSRVRSCFTGCVSLTWPSRGKGHVVFTDQ